MRFNSPSLPELHAFLAVCQLGSFRKAADALCVTQAAVSRAVLRLEQRLECRLLDRTGSVILPTPRGLEFQKLVEPHVAGLEGAVGCFGQSRITHKLRISVAPTLSTRWLIPRLSQFQAHHPDIEIEFRQFRYDEDFTRDDVDAWIEVKRPTRAWPRGLHARYLLGREIVPACTPALAVGLRQPHDLCRATLLHSTLYPKNWALWLSKAAGVDLLPAPGPGFDLGNNLIAAACAGMGIMMIQPALIEPELASGALVIPFQQSVDTNRGYYLCNRAALAHNDVFDLFAHWLMHEAQQSKTRQLC